MKKQKWVLIAGSVLLVLMCLGIGVYAQAETSAHTLTLTEADVNSGFTLPSPNSTTITDLTLIGVDLLADNQVQIAFSATVHGRNGQDHQVNIIAVLIGLLRSRGTVYTLSSVQGTYVTDGTSNTIMFSESEASRFSFVANAFNRYLRAQAQAAGIRGRTETVNNDESISINY